jgi:hypothetical protein
MVDHPIAPAEIEDAALVVSPTPEELLPADRAVVETRADRSVDSVEEALAVVSPAVRVKARLRVLPRVGEGRAVIHLLNRGYDPDRDEVRHLTDVELLVDLAALGVASSTRARVFSPETAPFEVLVSEGQLVLPAVGLWTIVAFEPR